MTMEDEHDDATTLRGLQAELPAPGHLDRVPGHLPRLVGAVGGRDGRNPWLVSSTDLDRFRRALDRAGWPF